MMNKGRPSSHCKLIGTTLRVTGPGYEHAAILDADTLDAKDLYVVMARWLNALIIISTERLVSLSRRRSILIADGET